MESVIVNKVNSAHVIGIFSDSASKVTCASNNGASNCGLASQCACSTCCVTPNTKYTTGSLSGNVQTDSTGCINTISLSGGSIAGISIGSVFLHYPK
jgi:uncharacterized protein (DUF2342 family)